jgi:hypothetical protein
MVEKEGSSASIASKSEIDTSNSKEISKGLDVQEVEDEDKKVEDIDVVRQVGLNNKGGE